MKREELIKKLQEMPEGTDVAIFDWRQNLHNDSGDAEGCGIGIHLDFEVSYEGKEEVAEGSKTFIALGFNNRDYDEEGRRIPE